MQKNKNILIETLEFIKQNKAWWFIPIIIMLFLIGFLIMVGQSSGGSPFIYVLF